MSAYKQPKAIRPSPAVKMYRFTRSLMASRSCSSSSASNPTLLQAHTSSLSPSRPPRSKDRDYLTYKTYKAPRVNQFWMITVSLTA